MALLLRRLSVAARTTCKRFRTPALLSVTTSACSSNGRSFHTNGTKSVAWLASLERSAEPLPLQPPQPGSPYDLPLTTQVEALPSELDAVIVLGGGLETGWDLPPWVTRRLDTAADMASASGCPILCLGGGTPHKPPNLTPHGFVIHEGSACAEYLVQHRGVAPSRLLKEVSSYDTVGNAYFGLTIHAIPAGWRKVAVVTSAFHMARTAALFQHMWALAARDVFRDPSWYSMWFASASDGGGLWEGDILAARTAKEAASLEHWRREAGGLTSLRDLHAWLHGTHQCYAVARQREFDKVTITDPKLLSSY